MRDWLWHLFNDPMRENPWSILLAILLMATILSPFAATWWKHRRR